MMFHKEGMFMIYVMSDIHGMYDKYIEMLKTIHFTDEDILYIIGDVIDRGQGSIRILQDMMNRFHVFPLFGNHELMAMRCLPAFIQETVESIFESLDDDKMLDLYEWIQNGGYPTLLQFQQLSPLEKEDIIDYLMEFTAYEEVEVNGQYFLLVHAGLGNHSESIQLEDHSVDDFVWERPDYEIPYFKDSNHYMIVGHTPTLSITGKPEIYHHNQYIVMDCGACFETGKLACLCLDTTEEFYV